MAIDWNEIVPKWAAIPERRALDVMRRPEIERLARDMGVPVYPGRSTAAELASMLDGMGRLARMAAAWADGEAKPDAPELPPGYRGFPGSGAML